MKYKNLIFTKHGKERLNDRTITADAVYQVINSPDQKFEQGKNWKFIRLLQGRKYHVVASYLKSERTWLIVSVWVRGEEDRVPLVWQLLTLPFKGVWWLLKFLAVQVTSK